MSNSTAVKKTAQAPAASTGKTSAPAKTGKRVWVRLLKKFRSYSLRGKQYYGGVDVEVDSATADYLVKTKRFILVAAPKGPVRPGPSAPKTHDADGLPIIPARGFETKQDAIDFAKTHFGIALGKKRSSQWLLDKIKALMEERRAANKAERDEVEAERDEEEVEADETPGSSSTM